MLLKSRLRAKVAVGKRHIRCVVAAFRAFQSIIAPVANVDEVRTAHAHRLREQRNQTEVDGQVCGLHPAIVEAVIHGAGLPASERLSQTLLRLHPAFQPLRGERRDIHRIIVKRRGGELPLGAVQPARRFVADQRALLQAPYVGAECERLVAAAEVQPGHGKGNSRAYPGSPLRLVGGASRLAGLKFQTQRRS